MAQSNATRRRQLHQADHATDSQFSTGYEADSGIRAAKTGSCQIDRRDGECNEECFDGAEREK